MPLLEMRQIVKEFPGVKALDGVTFDLSKRVNSTRWSAKTAPENPL